MQVIIGDISDYRSKQDNGFIFPSGRSYYSKYNFATNIDVTDQLNREQVCHVAKLCNDNCLPLIPFGSGTGLEEGVVAKKNHRLVSSVGRAPVCCARGR